MIKIIPVTCSSTDLSMMSKRSVDTEPSSADDSAQMVKKFCHDVDGSKSYTQQGLSTSYRCFFSLVQLSRLSLQLVHTD